MRRPPLRVVKAADVDIGDTHVERGRFAPVVNDEDAVPGAAPDDHERAKLHSVCRSWLRPAPARRAEVRAFPKVDHATTMPRATVAHVCHPLACLTDGHLPSTTAT